MEKLFKTAARDKNLDVSEVYFQPEGDVFVSYTRDYDVAVKMSAVLNTLISNDDYLTFVISQTCS
ncbi:hypothetical protein BN863_16040 [Formosa agariphila KMM 3901]|uniref:Uncharacterized protein n=1 Tax=Formosa agariphila (strain DSM 15362 / KCTC 12365 / LMG 23005 / KMM 3901 / M-2Alg 35-1) TaxID=1347342 RepID=T2KLM4_FORAG|nr:hypothetical protein [Formosa agariphila]CDF79316.1 hypothetical protein BN863_16040 [Formosa agariphila KMM 3901]